MALQMAAATLLPPFRPWATMYGTPAAMIRSLLSTTLTNPTGAPITSAGRTFPAAIRSNRANRAVGALPMAKMQGFSSDAASPWTPWPG